MSVVGEFLLNSAGVGRWGNLSRHDIKPQKLIHHSFEDASTLFSILIMLLFSFLH